MALSHDAMKEVAAAVIDPSSQSVASEPANPSTRGINRSFCTEKMRGDYAHVGLYDVSTHRMWLARNRWGMPASRVSHAKLLKGGGQNHSVADKDRFVCYWFHTPDTGSGPLHGYPIEWNEGHLIVRLDPNWSYQTCSFIPPADARRVEKNIEQQYDWGRRVFEAYCALGLKFPLSWHMLGPRASDSMFYVERREP